MEICSITDEGGHTFERNCTSEEERVLQTMNSLADTAHSPWDRS